MSLVYTSNTVTVWVWFIHLTLSLCESGLYISHCRCVSLVYTANTILICESVSWSLCWFVSQLHCHYIDLWVSYIVAILICESVTTSLYWFVNQLQLTLMVHKSYQLQLALPLCQFLFIYFQRAAMINKADNYHFREKDFYITFAIFRSSCFPCAMPLCSISCSLHFHLFPFYPCRRSSHQKQINFFYHFIAWVGLFRLRPDFRIQIS